MGMNKNQFHQAFFGYRAPTEVTKPKYKAIQDAVKALAEVLWAEVPDCHEKTRALRDLQGVRMWANAGVAMYTSPSKPSAPKEDANESAYSVEYVEQVQRWAYGPEWQHLDFAMKEALIKGAHWGYRFAMKEKLAGPAAEEVAK